jgi:hypothetical protein
MFHAFADFIVSERVPAKDVFAHGAVRKPVRAVIKEVKDWTVRT